MTTSLTLLADKLDGTGGLTEWGRRSSIADVRVALAQGGRAKVTVRSQLSGRHVTVLLTARKRGEDGRFVGRNTVAGRVGTGAASVIEARDPFLDYPDNYVGRFTFETGEWRAGRGADGARVWVAERIIAHVVSANDEFGDAEVFLSAECSHCGRELTDPESIERGVGPECYGRQTASVSASRS